MNKKIVICAIIIIIAIGGFFIVRAPQKKYEDYVKINSFSEIDAKELAVVTLGREGCSWCSKMKLVLTKVAKDKDIPIYYLDVNDIDEDHNYEVPSKCADFDNQKLLDGFGTPLNLVLQNGKIVDCRSGYLEESVYLSFLRRNDILE